MEMKIDEAIKYLKALKRCETCEENDMSRCKSCSCYRIGSSAKCYDAIDVVVEVLPKYQKIQEIMAKRPKDMISSNPTLRAINEVLADGNIK